MPRLEGVRAWGDPTPRDVDLGDDPTPVDARGTWLVPSFVDLHCEAGFPGFPVREDPESLAAAALAGGFTDLVTSPVGEPVLDTPEHLAAFRRTGPEGVRLWPLAALTRRLEGKELAELGLLGRHGALGVSDGGLVMPDTVVLRNALEYARAFGLTVWTRPADPHLDGLGHAHESPVAATVGLRGNPASAEVIGVARVVELARASGAAVHLGPLSAGRSVDLVRAARAEGLPVTAAVAARSLLLDETVLLDGAYDTRFRLHPPLRGESDRRALLAGVQDGTLLVCADHAPRAPEEKELEFERATPGSTGLETAFAAAWTALGDLDRVVEALAVAPRRLLRASPPGVAWVDLEAEVLVDPAAHRSRARNDALAGRRLRGRILGVWPLAGSFVLARPV